jgi:hypothetical protein
MNMSMHKGDDFWDDVASDIAHELVVEVAVEGIKWAAEGIGHLVKEASKKLVIVGAVGYTISGSEVEIRVNKISNRQLGGVSGTVKIKLWAVDTPYKGGSLSGYVFAERKLGEIKGGWYKYDINPTVDYIKPPSGKYFVVLTVNEYHKGEWPISDWVNFDNMLNV